MGSGVCVRLFEAALVLFAKLRRAAALGLQANRLRLLLVSIWCVTIFLDWEFGGRSRADASRSKLRVLQRLVWP